MATVGGFSRHYHLAELNESLVTGEGVLSPENRKERARENLGIEGTPASGDPKPPIANLTLTGTYTDDDDGIEAAVNGILAALREFGIIET